MGLQITNIRIQNFRSIEYLDEALTYTNLVLGQNNCGKSNLLKAINIALSANPTVTKEDIYVGPSEELARDKAAIIDILIRPIDENGEICESFSAFWSKVFTTAWISTGVDEGDFVGIRTFISYSPEFDSYRISRKQIKEWNSSIDTARVGKNAYFNADMQAYIFSFYMDAQRDIVADIKNQKSYFGRATSSKDLAPELVKDIEAQLDRLNQQIVSNTPTLKNTESAISQIGNVVGNQGSSLQIEPISRKISDLHKGFDIKFTDGNAASLSLEDHGMGTRSWVSFLTLGAYIKYLITCIQEQNPEAEIFAVLSLEEPEAHLHAAAQKKLYSQINTFQGQKIVSTHSPYIVSQANIEDFVHLHKYDGKTTSKRLDISEYKVEELAKIQREFIKSKGDLLFSTVVILAEGTTEEQALPIYFERYFGIDPSFVGVNIIGIGGQNYLTFIKLLNDFSIKWYIFSDGEQATIRTVSKAVTAATGKDLDDLSNVVIIDNGDDYEDHLIHSGYSQLMIDAINQYERILRLEIDPEGAERDPRDFFERYIEETNGTKAGQRKSGEVCPTCGKALSEEFYYDYNGDEGRDRALLDCCQKSKNKAKYASVIADYIIEHAASDKVIPPKVLELFQNVDSIIHLHTGD